jgi:hypothetical protein
MRYINQPKRGNRHLTTHSTGAEIARLSFVNLDACFVAFRPVNSGVRRLPCLYLMGKKVKELSHL